MNGAIAPHTPIAVDIWTRKAIANCRVFFLSHAHADHTAGLTKSWKTHKIYCSELTKDIVLHKIGLSSDLLVGLPVDQPVSIPLDDYGQEKMTVTLIDANHCPGAVMFLFQGYFGCILYTGDFRYCQAIADHPSLKSVSVDQLFLDNTYCDPNVTFPTRSQACQEAIGIVQEHFHKGFDIVIGLMTLGKEDLLVEIAKTCQTFIGVEKKRLDLLKVLGLPDVFTDDMESTQIRVVMQREITKEKLEEWNSCHPTIVILPTSRFEEDFNPYRNIPNIFVVPVSDHSSYCELEQFVCEIKPKAIIPIVKKHKNSAGEESYGRANMNVFSRYLNQEPLVPIGIPSTVLAFMDSVNSIKRPRAKRPLRYNYHAHKRKKCSGVVFPDELPDNEERNSVSETELLQYQQPNCLLQEPTNELSTNTSLNKRTCYSDNEVDGKMPKLKLLKADESNGHLQELSTSELITTPMNNDACLNEAVERQQMEQDTNCNLNNVENTTHQEETKFSESSSFLMMKVKCEEKDPDEEETLPSHSMQNNENYLESTSADVEISSTTCAVDQHEQDFISSEIKDNHHEFKMPDNEQYLVSLSDIVPPKKKLCTLEFVTNSNQPINSTGCGSHLKPKNSPRNTNTERKKTGASPSELSLESPSPKVKTEIAQDCSQETSDSEISLSPIKPKEIFKYFIKKRPQHQPTRQAKSKAITTASSKLPSSTIDNVSVECPSQSSVFIKNEKLSDEESHSPGNYDAPSSLDSTLSSLMDHSKIPVKPKKLTQYSFKKKGHKSVKSSLKSKDAHCENLNSTPSHSKSGLNNDEVAPESHSSEVCSPNCSPRTKRQREKAKASIEKVKLWQQMNNYKIPYQNHQSNSSETHVTDKEQISPVASQENGPAVIENLEFFKTESCKNGVCSTAVSSPTSTKSGKSPLRSKVKKKSSHNNTVSPRCRKRCKKVTPKKHVSQQQTKVLTLDEFYEKAKPSSSGLSVSRYTRNHKDLQSAKTDEPVSSTNNVDDTEVNTDKLQEQLTERFAPVMSDSQKKEDTSNNSISSSPILSKQSKVTSKKHVSKQQTKVSTMDEFYEKVNPSSSGLSVSSPTTRDHKKLQATKKDELVDSSIKASDNEATADKEQDDSLEEFCWFTAERLNCKKITHR